MQKLTAGYKKTDVYEDVVCVAQEEGNAMALLKLFKGDISLKALVERLLNSKEVKDSGQVFPRAFEFDTQCETGESNAINVIVGVAIGAAKVILPGDADKGARALRNRMTGSAAFIRFEVEYQKGVANSGSRQGRRYTDHYVCSGGPVQLDKASAILDLQLKVWLLHCFLVALLQ
jgi:hypothetical protein